MGCHTIRSQGTVNKENINSLKNDNFQDLEVHQLLDLILSVSSVPLCLIVTSYPLGIPISVPSAEFTEKNNPDLTSALYNRTLSSGFSSPLDQFPDMRLKTIIDC